MTNFLIEDFFHLPPVSKTPVFNLELRISPWIWCTQKLGGNWFMKKNRYPKSRGTVPLTWGWSKVLYIGFIISYWTGVSELSSSTCLQNVYCWLSPTEERKFSFEKLQCNSSINILSFTVYCNTLMRIGMHTVEGGQLWAALGQRTSCFSHACKTY
jgi:hypothetical protein